MQQFEHSWNPLNLDFLFQILFIVQMSAVAEVETKLAAVDLSTNKENDQKENCENPTSAKPEKKKGKKKSKVAVKSPEEKVEVSGVVGVLKDLDSNQSEDCSGPLCAFCKKSGPTKRCSKRHQKCLPKMFCNETCESLAHEDKKTALVKKEANKAVAAKKKNAQKVKNWKNTDSGQFWWHDQ